MNQRYLTITLRPDWKASLRESAKASKQDCYQGEGLLTEKRWELVRSAQGKGPLAIRELSRLVGRDVKRVHEDVGTLTELGLLERTEDAGVICPYASVHIDMHLEAA